MNPKFSPMFPKYTIADMITGFGVAEQFVISTLYGGDVKGKKRLFKALEM
jgi:hypothetical protein